MSTTIIQVFVALLMASLTMMLSFAGSSGFHSSRFNGPPCIAMATYSPPVAVASANPTTIIVGNKVAFDASASTDEYFVALYRWSYTVDNETRLFSGMYASQLLNRTGTFVVWLTVQNGWGMSDTDSVTITVLPASGPNSPPVAEAGTDINIAVDTAVGFDGSMSWDDIGIIDYLWTFEDGGTQVRLWGCSPYYLFASSGTYEVNLTVTDSGGLNASDQIRVIVESTPWPGMAEAGPNQTVSVGEEVTFNGSASVAYVQIASYVWTLIDDEPISLFGITVNYTFHSSGTHIVLLTIKDESMSPLSTDSLTVTVIGSASVTPRADAGPDDTIEAGTIYRFNGSGTDGDIRELGYVWRFRYNGTWEFLIGEKPSFLFSKAGRYLVTLTVTDDEMHSDNDTVTVTVLEKKGSFSSVPSNIFWLAILSSEGALIALAALIYAKQVRRKE